MPDLAFIHPLLVTNPLPTERLAAAVDGAASAGILAQRCCAAFLELPQLAQAFPALVFNEQDVHGHAWMWRNTLQPLLESVPAALSRYAVHLVQDLALLLGAAPFASTEPDARKTVLDGVRLLQMAAAAQQLTACEAALAADNFRSRFACSIVAYVVEIDKLADSLGNEDSRAARFWGQARQHQDALGKAMATVTAAVSALGAIESAWRGLVAQLGALLDQVGESSLNSALLLGRLNLAASDWRTLAARPGSDGKVRLAASQAPSGPAARQLAQAWPAQGRPSLLGSMATLKQFGDDFVARDAPRLQAAFRHRGSGDSAGRQAAAVLIAGIVARLAELVEAFESVRRDLGGYLGEVAAAPARLARDMRDLAHERQRWHWLLGPLGAILTKEIDGLGDKLAAVASQLSAIRAGQAASIGDATCLQQLLPALASYLSGGERAGAGLEAVLSGTRTLQLQLAELRGAILARPGAQPGTKSGATAQLQAALADWRAISRKIGQPAPGIA